LKGYRIIVNQSLRPPSITSIITSARDSGAPAPCPSCGSERDFVVLSGVEGYFIAAACTGCGKGERESRFYRGYERARAALDSQAFTRAEF
jgi:hypothetical protein